MTRRHKYCPYIDVSVDEREYECGHERGSEFGLGGGAGKVVVSWVVWTGGRGQERRTNGTFIAMPRLKIVVVIEPSMSLLPSNEIRIRIRIRIQSLSRRRISVRNLQARDAGMYSFEPDAGPESARCHRASRIGRHVSLSL